MIEIDWSKAPEGATHYCPETDDLMAAWFKPSGDEWLFAIDQSPMRYWRPYNEDFPNDMPLVQRPTAWNGEGLPPVGTVCEALWNTGRGEWLPVKVFGVNEHGQPIFRWEDGPEKYQYLAGPLTGPSGNKHFRPIRTPEQIAAEEREKAIKEMVEILGGLWASEAEAAGFLYDAGYRKQA